MLYATCPIDADSPAPMMRPVAEICGERQVSREVEGNEFRKTQYSSFYYSKVTRGFQNLLLLSTQRLQNLHHSVPSQQILRIQPLVI